MTHLEASEDELRESIQQKDPQVSKASEDDEKLQEEYAFHFKHTDGRGKVWEGDFVNKVLSIKDRGQAGILESTLNGGQPVDSMNDMIRSMNNAIAHMTFSLQKRPSWANDLRNLHDIGVVIALFGEVAEHEATFLGLKPNQAEG